MSKPSVSSSPGPRPLPRAQPPQTQPQPTQPSANTHAPATRGPVDGFDRTPARGARADGAQRGAQSRTPAPAAQPPAAQQPPGSTRVAATLAPRDASEAERFNHYANIVRANGGEVNPGGRPTVLGLRGVSLDGQQHNTTFRGGARGYDDAFVVLTADGHVRELRGATHPGQSRSTASPDVDRDSNHSGDVGMIRPGNYEVVPNGPHAGAESFHIRTLGHSGTLPGWRDTDHTGSLSAAERAASEQRRDTLTEVLFHQGRGGPISIGCQTMEPSEFRNFVNAVGGGRARFNYTLVDANAAP